MPGLYVPVLSRKRTLNIHVGQETVGKIIGSIQGREGGKKEFGNQ